jgi:hypothetical protein
MGQDVVSNIRHLESYASIYNIPFSFRNNRHHSYPALGLPPTVISVCSGSGIGSRLQALTLGGAVSRAENQTELVASSWTDVWMKTVPSMVYLQSLTVFEDHCRLMEDRVGLVYKAIRQNGCLSSVLIGSQDPATDVFHSEASEYVRYWGVSSFFSEDRQRRINAILERNVQLPLMLAAPMIDDNVDGQHANNVDGEHANNVDGEHANNIDGENANNIDGEHANNIDGEHANNVDGEHDGNARVATAVPMFPPLFQASHQSPRMAFRNNLIGLLALGPPLGDVVQE